MTVKEAIQKRRAYRSLEKILITEEIKKSLAEAAQLAPSCFNKQPWRYVFVDNEEMLKKLYPVYSKGNEWAYDASMVIVVFSNKELDCIIKDRLYYTFDTGLATGQMILQAEELGLVAHPIAGFSPSKVKNVLNIPEEMEVITLLILGKYKENVEEANRPVRKELHEIVYYNQL